jgi:hypothetical protein
MSERTLKQITDSCLQKWVDRGLNKRPGEIEPEMAGEKDKEGWTTWFPIDSKVTDSEVSALEKEVGHPLPSDYKSFLKYKHFYELHISEAEFCHPVNTWRRILVKTIFEGYPRIFLIERGYLPFADWCDWGLLCFDTNTDDGRHDYPVVLWDHERVDSVTLMSNNFSELMSRLGREENERTFE